MGHWNENLRHYISTAILIVLPGVTVVKAQLGVAHEKPVFASSQGGTPVDNPMSNANDPFLYTVFYTEDLPWSFVAVDMEDFFEIDRMALQVNSGWTQRAPTVGVSRNRIDPLDDQNVVCLDICGAFSTPPFGNADMNIQCTAPVIGRYAYAFIPEPNILSGRYALAVNHLEAYGQNAPAVPNVPMTTADPLSLWPTPTSFVVTLTCRDRLARTTGLRPCHTMDPDLERLICELRDLSDRHVLSSVAAISGMTEFPHLGNSGVTASCAPLSVAMYYCTEIQTGPGLSLETDSGCPFLNITNINAALPTATTNPLCGKNAKTQSTTTTRVKGGKIGLSG